MNTGKKKGTPSGAPTNRHYDTTPEELSQAQILFNRIGTGKRRALKRPRDLSVDRQLRTLIEHANNTGDCIINIGDGYFRPGEDDEYEFRSYMAKERRRAKMLSKKIECMNNSYYGR